MKTNHLMIGKLGEEIACKYLQDKDFNILERNFRTSFAEIDIICKNNDLILFVEVKTRKNDNIVCASDSVDFTKIQKIKKLARHFIMLHRLYDFNFRFDVIECYWDLRKINHIESAFD